MSTRPILAALFAVFAATSLSSTGCIDLGEVDCTSDEQCRYDRVCSPQGYCVSPNPTGPSPIEPGPDTGPDVPEPEPAPRIAANPARLVFERIGNSDPTWRRGWRETVIRNAGTLPLRIDAVSLTGDEAFELGTPPDAGWPDELAPGESFEVRVWYGTQSSAPMSAELVVESNDPRGPFTVPVSADQNPPCIEVEPERNMVFRPQAPGERIVKEIVITNCATRSNLALRAVRLEIDSGGGFYLPEDALPERLPELSALVDPGESVVIPIVYTGRSFEWNEGEVVIETNVPDKPVIRIGLLRETDANDCPVARAGARREGSDVTVPFVRSLRAQTGETVELSGLDSVDPDGDVERYSWEIVARPEGSESALMPNTFSSTVNLPLDVPGQYLVELDVWDDQGEASCGGVSRVTVVAE
ncbi:hypothetical protein FIV42_07860 [Persicimonas caeni]|uniref:Choice-of-anchor D domain-containing protein n=1 Tax=Persicimonas caeni TaxID=2292766 RepID=A0A4Y6PRB0_PERCE|nr:hypothetical protein [Persicimonas caeni]QDG50649.1 hypothetical protein FIV42_07860 [Persicimonas caeni]QED31870.1 hypothetical protein FRD00_07855 [Persicimonas caeni]